MSLRVIVGGRPSPSGAVAQRKRVRTARHVAGNRPEAEVIYS
jgi:hypothetical protein